MLTFTHASLICAHGRAFASFHAFHTCIQLLIVNPYEERKVFIAYGTFSIKMSI